MILCLHTATAVAELRLYGQGVLLASRMPELGRAMALRLPGEVEALLGETGKDWQAIGGIVVFRGPGSFTGLRIGITLANTLAYGLRVPIVGELGDAWLETGLRRLEAGDDDRLVLPHYGAEPHTTRPKK